MMPPALSPWITLALDLEPDVPIVIAAFKRMFAKHPALADPAAQQAFVQDLGTAAGQIDDATIAKIVADQAAHAAALPKQS